jgi:hypothetical protein
MERMNRRGSCGWPGGRRGVQVGRLLPLAIGLAVLIGVFAWGLVAPRDQASAAAPQKGGARLTVDKDFIDFGKQPYGKYVLASFRLKNAGDQPLLLPQKLAIEVVEGC